MDGTSGSADSTIEGGSTETSVGGSADTVTVDNLDDMPEVEAGAVIDPDEVREDYDTETIAFPGEYDSDSQNYTYTGTGGVPIGSLFNRLVFSLEYQERNILFNSSINPDSKIMYVRKPEDRVQEVAPWLTTDSDPYPEPQPGFEMQPALVRPAMELRLVHARNQLAVDCTRPGDVHDTYDSAHIRSVMS